jgi:hypothetical protein
MPKTAVGLFKNPDRLDKVGAEVARLDIPRREVRTLEKPLNFEVAGVMSFPRLDFEVRLEEELIIIGATDAQAQALLEGVRAGGTLATATGNDRKADAAVDVMNRYAAAESEEGSGPGAHLPRTAPKSSLTTSSDSVMAAGFATRAAAAAFLFGEHRRKDGFSR